MPVVLFRKLLRLKSQCVGCTVAAFRGLCLVQPRKRQRANVFRRLGFGIPVWWCCVGFIWRGGGAVPSAAGSAAQPQGLAAPGGAAQGQPATSLPAAASTLAGPASVASTSASSAASSAAFRPPMESTVSSSPVQESPGSATPWVVGARWPERPRIRWSCSCSQPHRSVQAVGGCSSCRRGGCCRCRCGRRHSSSATTSSRCPRILRRRSFRHLLALLAHQADRWEHRSLRPM